MLGLPEAPTSDAPNPDQMRDMAYLKGDGELGPTCDVAYTEEYSKLRHQAEVRCGGQPAAVVFSKTECILDPGAQRWLAYGDLFYSCEGS